MNQSEMYSSPVLVHWTYTRDEWRRFIRWKKQKKGFLYYIIHRLWHNIQLPVPEVKITPEQVWIGNEQRHFSNDQHQLRRIEIRNEGQINVMEITYRWSKRKTTGLGEIRIPVPRGKLKEAIEVEEKLNVRRGVNRQD